MMKRLFLTALILIVLSTYGNSQEKQKRFSFDGYLTTLQSAMFDSLSGPVQYDNILHNRLNFKGYINKNIVVAAEFRNRLFTGDMAGTGSAYSEITGIDPGWADLSWNILNEKSFFLKYKLLTVYGLI